MYIMYIININGLFILIGCFLFLMMMYVYIYYLLCKENTYWIFFLLYNVIDVRLVIFEYR